MNSYGKFGRYEIRDVVSIFGTKHENMYDLVLWNEEHETCFSIGFLKYDEREMDFEFKSVGLRYLEFGTERLSEWLIKWCEMKKVELEG